MFESNFEHKAAKAYCQKNEGEYGFLSTFYFNVKLIKAYQMFWHTVR